VPCLSPSVSITLVQILWTSVSCFKRWSGKHTHTRARSRTHIFWSHDNLFLPFKGGKIGLNESNRQQTVCVLSDVSKLIFPDLEDCLLTTGLACGVLDLASRWHPVFPCFYVVAWTGSSLSVTHSRNSKVALISTVQACVSKRGLCSVLLFSVLFHRGAHITKYVMSNWYLLRAFARLRKATISFVMSVGRHGKIQVLLDGFSWNLIFEYFSKIWQE
jgi:hypothetical protein